MLIRRCFECNGLKYDATGKPCSVCGGTGFLKIATREDNFGKHPDRRVGERRKRDRREGDRRRNYRRSFEKHSPNEKY